MTKRWLRVCLLLAGCVAVPAAAQAPDNKIPVYKLELRKVEDIPTGDAALVAGSVGSTPDRFFLENLYMLKPVSVTVRAVNPGDVVTAKLTKERWDQVLREASTGAQNQVNFKFRTHGEFQLSISAPKPDTPYKLMVWVGPDIVPKPVKPIFAPNSQFESSNNWTLWGGAAAGLIILVLATLLFMKRKKAS
jgi:LPXTG-motif cell wall-anchored protein